MRVIEQYNALDQQHVSRQELRDLLALAEQEEHTSIIANLQQLLINYDDECFFIVLKNKMPFNQLHYSALAVPTVEVSKKIHETPIIISSHNQEIVEPVSVVHEKNTPHEVVAPEPEPEIQKTPVVKKAPKPVKKTGLLSMDELHCQGSQRGYFSLNNELGQFIGNVEAKPSGSVVATLDAPPGSGKTRFLFQLMNAYAQAGKTSIFFSLEESPKSNLFLQKRDQYIANSNRKYINTIGDEDVNNYKQVKQLIEAHDLTFIDSFGKLQKLLRKQINLSVDDHLRKPINGKFIIAIFQRTKDNKMRGGADAPFDADINWQVELGETFKQNEVATRKNRYSENTELTYNIYRQQLVGEGTAPQQAPEKKLVLLKE